MTTASNLLQMWNWGIAYAFLSFISKSVINIWDEMFCSCCCEIFAILGRYYD